MDSHSLHSRSVGIIGGAGEIGQVINRYFTELGYSTHICDPGHPQGLSLEQLLDCCQIVYLSVFPLEAAAQVLEQITHHPRAGELVLLENATIKSVLQPALKTLDNMGTSICATHPMCRADQPWKNQNVMLIPFGKQPDPALIVARQLYDQAQMNIKELGSIAEHDELMALLQLVPHLTLRVVSTIFEQLGVDLDLLNSSATANFKLFYMSFWRVQAQSPELSASIIWQLLQDQKGREVSSLLRDKLAEVASMDRDQMTETFRSFYQESGLSPAHIEQMNQQCVVTLERLANLDRRAITITASRDEVGMLRRILAPFDELGLNICAIDSHLNDQGEISFEIGIDEAPEDKLVALKQRMSEIGKEFDVSL